LIQLVDELPPKKQLAETGQTKTAITKFASSLSQKNLNNFIKKLATTALIHAEVMTEYYSAKVAGDLPALGESDSFGVATAQRNANPSTLTRQTVRTELKAVKVAGPLLLEGDHMNLNAQTALSNNQSRAEVRAAAVIAADNTHTQQLHVILVLSRNHLKPVACKTCQLASFFMPVSQGS
jgi:hypothetical protein